MMPSTLNANHMVGVSHLPHTEYAADTTMLDELSRQLAAANNSRRLSRGSGSQRLGNAMRIAKPGSANNSPRSNILQSRRRTLIGEGHQRPHLQPLDAAYLPTPMYELNCEPTYEPEKRPARPVSWHPSSLQVSQAMSCTLPAYSEADQLPSYQQFPPTPTAYSGYNSPASAFSPLSLPYSNINSQQYYSPSARSFHAQPQPRPQLQVQQPQQPQIPTYQPTQSPSYSSCAGATSSSSLSSASSELPYLPAPRLPMTAGGAFDWDAFAAQGFDRYAAPPTPEDFVVSHQPLQKLETAASPKVAVEEETIPYQPLDDDESDGEILYGMGLYDAPDRESAIDFHRSTVFSLLGGSSHQERPGKGLKLEDAWEPPASDDEDDEEEEDDAEGEDQE
ncbi:hypothetical protein B0T16DRAFT_462448 [Cercophora newfieldiana]|uniref:Uncharacterized protein n=1 Tax=Cercophora newfieldiana TaxID=92897 RepID=A0AA40CH59_9PEZI|nr:hypothetical protein B0T16DRAFT_462448 [Cercophora newfieldiana]